MDKNAFLSLCLILVSSYSTTYLGISYFLKSSLINLFVDIPNERKVHCTRIPRAGGICIIIALTISLFLWHFLFKYSLPLLNNKLLLSLSLISFGIFIIGFLDDIIYINLGAKTKFIFEIIITTFIVIFFQFYPNEILLFRNKTIYLGWTGIPIAIFWIVGIINAINIIDGIDGLAGTISFISLIGISIIAGLAYNVDIIILCVICIALIIGFLFHNMSPAKIFLGDTGSLLLGTIIAFLTIHIISLPEKKYPIFIAPLLIGYPILDLSLAMIRRFVKTFLSGKNLKICVESIFQPDNEHIHHRLLYKGLDHPKIVLILSIYSITLILSAIFLSYLSLKQIIITFGYILVMTLWFLFRLHFFDRFLIFITKKLFHQKKIKKVTIHIINADNILKHSLQEYNQNIFNFQFQTTNEISHNENTYPIVFFNNSPNNLEEDINLIVTTKLNKTHKVLIVTNKQKLNNFKKIPNNISFLDSSFYIPNLLNTFLLYYKT